MNGPRVPGREAEEAAGFSGEEWLGSLDPIGWRFGLERITALLAALGDPQHEFESIHVVGTNGKSSVTLMTAALLEASGRPTGAYLSPHTERWTERVRIRGAEINAGAFGVAGEKVAAAVTAVESGFEEDESVTQFEAATAVAFVALADSGVEVGVIEAGLGGRLDATNVLASSVTVLTSIGLDHTQWLGETEREIAAEKLAVLQPGSALVLGDISDAVAVQARALAAERHCEVLETAKRTETSSAVPHSVHRGTFGLPAPYLERNLDVALATARVVAGEIESEVIERALRELELPGRFEINGTDPPVIRDAAHNPDGAAALAEAIAAQSGERPVVACLAVLGDKDATGIIEALAPVLSTAVCTEIPPGRLEGAGRPGTSAVDAEELARLCEEAGVPASVCRDPAGAIVETLRLARDQPAGVALIAGSHYLLGY